jgi:hypothetical protein
MHGLCAGAAWRTIGVGGEGGKWEEGGSGYVQTSVVALCVPTSMLDGRGVGVRVPVGARFFCSRRRPDRIWGPLSLLSSGYRGALSPGVKRPGRDADH